jgi:hypothetical protein
MPGMNALWYYGLGQFGFGYQERDTQNHVLLALSEVSVLQRERLCLVKLMPEKTNGSDLSYLPPAQCWLDLCDGTVTRPPFTLHITLHRTSHPTNVLLYIAKHRSFSATSLFGLEDLRSG